MSDLVGTQIVGFSHAQAHFYFQLSVREVVVIAGSVSVRGNVSVYTRTQAKTVRRNRRCAAVLHV